LLEVKKRSLDHKLTGFMPQPITVEVRRVERVRRRVLSLISIKVEKTQPKGVTQ